VAGRSMVLALLLALGTSGLALLLLLASGPAVGVHTLRADDSILRLAAESAFSHVVQLLSWQEVEPAPGELYWEYPDWLVRACQHYGLALVLRLDHPPAWALRPGESPPVDLGSYAAFVEQVASRYRGRVRAYIIWNEPNLAHEWAGLPPDPHGYARLLQAGAEAVRRADPAALVVAAGVAPTNQKDERAVDDRAFFGLMLEASEGTRLDALAVHPYGFGRPPTAPLATGDGLVFARVEAMRELAENHGHGGTPFWATEFGWTVGPAEQADAWQVVSPEQQAQYLAQAVRVASQRHPWLQLMAVWNLALNLSPADEWSGYSLVGPNGSVRPALCLLRQLPQLRAGRLRYWLRLVWRRLAPSPSEVQILGPDVVVRLSDVDTPYPHWGKPYSGKVPARSWRGVFYLGNPSHYPWRLCLETMQVEEGGNFVSINGRPLLPPAIPVVGKAPFASVWTQVCLDVPAGTLRPGRNTIEVALSPRLPTQQDVRYESMQFRNVRLTRSGRR
jgi:hypothetical protein